MTVDECGLAYPPPPSLGLLSTTIVLSDAIVAITTTGNLGVQLQHVIQFLNYNNIDWSEGNFLLPHVISSVKDMEKRRQTW